MPTLLFSMIPVSLISNLLSGKLILTNEIQDNCDNLCCGFAVQPSLLVREVIKPLKTYHAVKYNNQTRSQ